jgi:hypothetical protein
MLMMHIYQEITQIKVNVSLYRPWRPLGLPEVEAPTFSHIWLLDGGKVVSPTCWLLFTPPGQFLVFISVRDCINPRAVVWLEGIGKLEKSTSSGTRTSYLPTCSIVPRPSTLPRAPNSIGTIMKNTETQSTIMRRLV